MLPAGARAVFLATLGLSLVRGVFAQDGKVVINGQWPIQNPKGQSELSPPVVEQGNQCAKSVFVTGFIPGATITVFLGGSTVIGGPLVSVFGFVDIPVTHQLQTNDKITAIQTVNGVKSAPSAIMTVSSMPPSLPPPTIDAHVYACGRVAAVHNLVSGVTVEVRDTNTNLVVGTGATPNPWGSDWDPVGTSSLTKGHLLVATQSACTGVASVASAKTPVLADPSPATAPTLDTPIVGNNAITANGLNIGSLLEVSQGAVIGSGFSTASSNWMTVPPIKASPAVTAQQALCAKGPVSPGVTPTTAIPVITLVGPICPGSPGAVVRDSSINATLVLLKNNTVVGYGGAGPGDVALNLAPPNAFAQGDTIQVVEYIGSDVVFSNKITVGCTNTLTYHNDAQRTGWNQSENTLTPANVTPSTFGFITRALLDDEVDTQPLVVTNQNIFGQGIHTVVYVTTESNTVYALDSWSGTQLLPPRSLGAPVSMPLGCNNNGPQVGINGTPVIDQKSQTMYVIAYTSVSGTPTYQLHALDLSTLKDKPGSPVNVKATHGPISFNASVQRQRSALLLTNGNVYAAFASFCDFSANTSRGWVLGWNSTTLAPLGANELTNTLATSPSNFFLSSIWMSGYGVAADTSGNVFFVTGNSDPGSNTYTGTTNIQESVVKMTSDLTKVLDLFTPSNVFPLDQGDTDYGSGGVMVIPDLTGTVPHLAIAAGKDGRNFILNRDKLGGFHNPDIPKHVVVDACWCGPSYFKGSDGVSRVVSSGGLTARTWKVNASASTALSLEAAAASFASGPHDGGFFTSVSSNGATANTALIWAVARPAGSDTHSTLAAFNGTASGASLTQLWSGQAGTWPNTNSNPNIVPTVANGRVYVASYKQIQIFGLIDKVKGRQALPPRFTQITQGPDPAVTPVNIPGAAYWGTVKSVNGSQIVITLRTGKSLTVDLSPAMKTGAMVHPFIGLTVAASGTLGSNGVLEARTLTRAKGQSGWGVDKAK